MATKKFSEYAIQGNNITLTYDNVNDTVTFDVNVDKNDVGLGNVDNTSDLNKPISTATQTALDAKASTTALTTHTSDLNNPHAVTKAQVGLSNVDNTSDLNKPISTATQTALNAKQDSLGFTPVTNARTLTINGTTYDLSANRTWSVGDLVSTGSYANPIWLTSLAWGKLTGTPTTLGGYGITDAVPSSRTLTINGTTYDLSADRSWTISTATPTLAQVTTAGNTTTNSISVGGLTVATNLIYTDTVNGRVGIGTTTPTTGHLMTVNGNLLITSAILQINRNSLPHIAMNASGANYGLLQNQSATSWSLAYGSASTTLGTAVLTWFGGTGNVGINTTTDAGYKLDVNGSFRANTLTVASSGFIQLNNIGINGASSTLRSVTNNDLELNSFAGKALLLQNIAYTPAAAGTQIGINFVPSFTTSTASAIFNGFVVAPTINQTGGANGITRGIYINPTLTAAADFRAIDVAGGKIVSTASITASAALAQGVYFNNTLVASANNDVLVGLDINPTFTNGAFTGVSNWALRSQGYTLVEKDYGLGSNSLTPLFTIRKSSSSQSISLGYYTRGTSGTDTVGLSFSDSYFHFLNGTTIVGAIGYNGNWAVGQSIITSNFTTGTNFLSQGITFGGPASVPTTISTSTSGPSIYLAALTNYSGDLVLQARTSSTNKAIYFVTGGATAAIAGMVFATTNWGIGTTTDAGYKLDVNGTTRLNGALTLGMTPIAAASVVSTHKLQITIAGTTYYLLASNV